MRISDIKVGMKYENVRNKIIKSKEFVIGELPSFCGSDYEIVENLNTKEKVYVLWNYDTGIITDVTDEYYKAVNTNRATENLQEILQNNGY